MENTEELIESIKDLISDTPNDMDLGKKIRSLFTQLEEKNILK